MKEEDPKVKYYPILGIGLMFLIYKQTGSFWYSFILTTLIGTIVFDYF